jgi:hypothetical protein
MHSMASDRRRAFRSPFFIECSWTNSARITDISLTGCYVDSRLVPKEGEPVEFTAEIAGGTVILRGTVVNPRLDLGFGVRFEPLPDDTQVSIHAELLATGRVTD